MLLSVIQEQLKSQIMTYNKDFLDVEFEFPQDIKHGHLSTNVAMRYSKIVQKSPRDLANELINSLNLDFIEKIEVAGPGFINFYFKAEVFTNSLKDNYTAVAPAEVPDTVVVDYSAPNIAKPLGIHHVLSTVIGQAVVNLMRAQNHKVIAWNYLGDWGTQFGKLLYAYKNYGNKAVIEQDPIGELLKLYVQFHDKAEKNPELEDAGRLEFKKLEQKDPENLALWEWIVDLSKKDLAKVYQKLKGIQFDVYSGEADRESELRDILKDGLAEGVFSLGEKNAIIADLSDQNMVPYIVQKSDGATLYSTRDIASVKHRVEQYGANKLVYVVDTAQNFHFKQLFAVASKFSWFKKDTKLEHLEFGRMTFANGKMSTRKGNILLLETILDQAVAKAKAILLEKNPNFDPATLDATAEIIGIGSIKYSVLSQAPETNITFDWNKIISFEGNAAPYLQYSCARANSILNQAGNIEGLEINLEYNLSEAETELILEFLKFEHTVNIAADKLRPNLLANYLYDLARSFNSFYVGHPILNNPDTNQQAVRLSITKSFQSIMKKGLNLLAGIEVPEKM